MYLQSAINEILEQLNNQQILHIKKQLAVMSEEWFSQKWKMVYQKLYFYNRSFQKPIIEKLFSLQMKRYQIIQQEYQKIVQQFEKHTIDVTEALEQLNNILKQYDDEIDLLKKQCVRYNIKNVQL